MDEDLVELIAGFPIESLLHGGSTRGLYRHALRGLVPDTVRQRRDKGTFGLAIAEMLGPQETTALRDLSTMRALGGLGLVQPDRYQSTFGR